MQPVLFTARSGATISGTVWATKAGPAKRPGIVITNGSVQAGEQLYWFAAQTLAKAGYVVLTSDPQGQGQSDERGEAPDESEGSPAQSDGRPFYDGTTDALDFFLSTPDKPFVPRKSCNTGTSHAPKQERRVKAGLNTAFNPFHALVDPSRIGIAGHSFGAAGVSYIGQKDPRVKAIVAWDNLGAAVANDGGRIGATDCPADPSERAPATITKPALGIAADYFIPPTPNTSDPDPLAKSIASRKYSEAKVDTGELIIRGGTHYDFDWIPNEGFPATLRGADMITWYTTAWFDKYVKGDATADQRLVTDRWRADADEAAVDPKGDGNMFSFYYRSRLDIGLSGGGRFLCEDLRPGCPGLTGARRAAAQVRLPVDRHRQGRRGHRARGLRHPRLPRAGPHGAPALRAQVPDRARARLHQLEAGQDHQGQVAQEGRDPARGQREAHREDRARHEQGQEAAKRPHLQRVQEVEAAAYAALREERRCEDGCARSRRGP